MSDGRINGHHSYVLDADVVVLATGDLLVVHTAAQCLTSDACVIHSPSAHPLRDAPLVWDEALGLMFRRCVHGKVHPDPDAVEFANLTVAARRSFPMLAYDGWHPCCTGRCCLPDQAA